jgi:hypothetical protein
MFLIIQVIVRIRIFISLLFEWIRKLYCYSLLKSLLFIDLVLKLLFSIKFLEIRILTLSNQIRGLEITLIHLILSNYFKLFDNCRHVLRGLLVTLLISFNLLFFIFHLLDILSASNPRMSESGDFLLVKMITFYKCINCLFFLVVEWLLLLSLPFLFSRTLFPTSLK